jgi:hypothetical protein
VRTGRVAERVGTPDRDVKLTLGREGGQLRQRLGRPLGRVGAGEPHAVLGGVVVGDSDDLRRVSG